MEHKLDDNERSRLYYMAKYRLPVLKRMAIHSRCREIHENVQDILQLTKGIPKNISDLKITEPANLRDIQTTLQTYIMIGNEKIVLNILEKMSKPFDISGETLKMAVIMCMKDVVQTIVQNTGPGFDINYQDKYGCTAAHWAACAIYAELGKSAESHSGAEQIWDILVKKGAASIRNKFSHTPVQMLLVSSVVVENIYPKNAKFYMFYRDCSVFSQFHQLEIRENGFTFPTNEHYMHFMKASLFNDDVMALNILTAATPLSAKRLGRKVQNFNEEVWKAHRIGIVLQANLLKFTQHADARKKLLEIGDVYFVETNPRDLVWGIGYGSNNPNAQNPKLWRGNNLLGKILDAVREYCLYKYT